MFLTVDYLFTFALNLIRKNQVGGYGNEQFEIDWHNAQLSLFSDLLGRFQAKNNSKEGANTGIIENETINQKLSVFTLPYDLTIEEGKADKPKDFVYRTSLMINGYDCHKLNYNQRDSAVHSVIDPPSISENRYYFFEYEGYYEFLPNTVTVAVLDYIQVPSKIVWGFTYDSDGRMVYNEGSSKHPKWNIVDCMEITQRMMKTIGVSFKDKDFENFGQGVIATGS